MPQLRQLVIAAENPSRLSAFYQDVFELEKIDEAKEAVFLSDGVFNLALVTEPDARKQGLRHLSFDTVRVESMGKKLASAGVTESSLVQVDTVTGVEFELRDPDGNPVNIPGPFTIPPQPMMPNRTIPTVLTSGQNPHGPPWNDGPGAEERPVMEVGKQVRYGWSAASPALEGRPSIAVGASPRKAMGRDRSPARAIGRPVLTLALATSRPRQRGLPLVPRPQA